MNTIDTKHLIVAKLREDMASDLAGIAEHEKIAELLRTKFKGKTINARLATLAKPLFPDSIVCMEGVASSHVNLRVDGRHHLIGHNRDLTNYDPETFERNAGPYGDAARRRVERYTRLLEDDAKLTAWAAKVDAIRSAWKDIETIEHGSDEGELRYILLRLTGLDKRR